MKLLVSFFPIILFFAVYKFYGIYVSGPDAIYAATAVAIVAAFIQTLWHWFVHKEVEKTHLITLVMLVVLGGMTLAFRDPTFIKWKPSVVNWLFGAAFLLSPLFGKPLTERLMGHAIEVPDIIWKQLNYAWAIFFIAVGFLNLYVAYNYDEETWVNFKMFGLLGLTVLFIFLQAFYLARYMPEAASEEQ